MRVDQDRDWAVVDFEARLTTSGTRPTVVVRGEVDQDTASTFAAIVDTAVRRGPVVVLDLRDLWFIDTTGLRVLIDAHLRLGQVPEAIVLRDPPPLLRRLLHIFGVEDLFTLQATRPPLPTG